MRRRHHFEHENHERWLISYADFITLLFAFFVVLFAASQADKGKAQRVAEAVRRALEQGYMGARFSPSPVAQPSQAASPPGNLAELTPSWKTLTADLQEDIKAGRLRVSLEQRGLVISVKEATIFNSGDDVVRVEAYNILEKIAVTIKRIPNPVRLEGHTDSIPISTPRFRSNWHLSVARSLSMLELLTDRFQVPSGRLAVVGYGDSIPLDGNDTAEGRARNRRVDITILSDLASLREAHAPTD